MGFKDLYPNYDITEDGKVFKDGIEMMPFRSNKYLQVLLYDTEHKRHIFGVHTLVAMVYLPDFYVGCIVHHKDKNCHNNNVDNLEIMSRSEHARKHGKEYCACGEYSKIHGSWNKGKHLSETHKTKLSEAYKRNLSKMPMHRMFYGNQYVDEYGNQK